MVLQMTTSAEAVAENSILGIEVTSAYCAAATTAGIAKAGPAHMVDIV